VGSLSSAAEGGTMPGSDTKIVVGKFGGGSLLAPIWTIGWLFTIGYVHLHFWKGLLALILWPFYLGNTLSHP
jgi:hypothetical protein